MALEVQKPLSMRSSQSLALLYASLRVPSMQMQQASSVVNEKEESIFLLSNSNGTLSGENKAFAQVPLFSSCSATFRTFSTEIGQHRRDPNTCP